MSKLGKLFFCITSLAPCAFAYVVNLASRGALRDAIIWLAIGVLLCFVCWAILKGSQTRLQRQVLKSNKIKLADKEILAFLLAYLLPLASTSSVEFKGEPLTAIFVYLVIGLCVYHSNAFTFNPVLAFFGYHFFEVENDENVTYLLISRRQLHSGKGSIEVVVLGEYLLLDTGG